MKSLYDTALEVATRAHAGQTRKFNGEPYINHPIRVAAILRNGWLRGLENTVLEAAALAHDILEDTPLTPAHLQEAGIPDIVVEYVLAVTRRSTETYAEFIESIADHSPEAIMIKLADIQDNLSDLKDGSLRDKYELARMYLNARLKKYLYG